MKCLSILQPWASLCVTTDPATGKAYKQIETRSWNTKYRGPLLIHASVGKQYRKLPTDSPLWMNCPMRLMETMPFGAIIGMVNLVDTFKMGAVWGMIQQNMKISIGGWEVDFSEQEIAFGDYSSQKRYGWLLSDPILFKTPIPCKGNLSIWNLPTELEDTVIRELSNATDTIWFVGHNGEPLQNTYTPTAIASPGEGALIVEPAEKSKCFEFPAFGASYPDAQCSGGYLWDLDSVDDGHFTSGGDIPCPVCNHDAYIEYLTGYRPGDPEYEEEQKGILAHMKFIYQKYGNMEYVPAPAVEPNILPSFSSSTDYSNIPHPPEKDNVYPSKEALDQTQSMWDDYFKTN